MSVSNSVRECNAPMHPSAGEPAPWKRAEIAYEAQIAGQYDELYYDSPIARAHLQAFVRLIERHVKREHRVLDLGGGTGAVTVELLRRGYRRVVASDLSEAMLRQAKRKARDLQAVVCDGERLPFKDGVFHGIICSSVLHHMPYPERVLEDARRALALYGVLVAQEPHARHFLTHPEVGQLNAVATGVMHYLYRLEQHEERAEPAVHEYHRAFSRRELVRLFSRHFYLLEFTSKFPFSCLFTKLRSRTLAHGVLALDRFAGLQDGSVFHIVCSKADAGHRSVLMNYFTFVEHLTRDRCPKEPWLFVVGLLPLVIVGRLYELTQRVRHKMRSRR